MPPSQTESPGPTVAAHRLWDDIVATARFGGTAGGGITRLALSQEDRQVRDWFAARSGELGCELSIDAIGNMFALYPGRDPALPPIAMGSHLDTQPLGGRFDGILGVLAGLEVLRALKEAGCLLQRPLAVINWANEEGARFSPAMFGSGVHAGALPLDDALGTRDRDGTSVRNALDAIGYRGAEAPGARRFAAYLELHIEQGPVLEDEGRDIGIVTGVQGLRWFDIEVEGLEAHAGSTPMGRRRDALVVAAELVLAARDIARRHAPGVITAGHCAVSPNSRNVVPGRARLEIDMRHPEAAGLDAMETELVAVVQAANHGATTSMRRIWAKAPVAFDPVCIAAIGHSAAVCGLSAVELASGAGHDAAHMAALAPTGMIFIPSRDGLSHNENEYSTPEQCARGAQVLLEAVVQIDRLLPSRPG